MKTYFEIKEIEAHHQEWTGHYKYIPFSIVFWKRPEMADYPDLYKAGGIWNSYISISKHMIPKEFDSIIPKKIKYLKRKGYEYGSLEKYFDMGLTFFEMIYDDWGEVFGFKVGNDYNHIWNHGGYDVEDILNDVKKSIDKFTECFPRYKAWSIINGHWIMAKNLEAYNAKKRIKP